MSFTERIGGRDARNTPAAGADPPSEDDAGSGTEEEVVVSGARNVWWLDLAGYDAEAWRWLAEGVDEYMDHDDKIAYLGRHLSVAFARS